MTKIKVKQIEGIQTEVIENKTIATLNTIPTLANTPVVGSVRVTVNGLTVDTFSGAFTVSGSTVTWVAGSAGYTLETTDKVVVTYLK